MRRLIIIFFVLYSFNYAQFTPWEYFGEMPRPVAGGELWQDMNNLYILGGYSDSIQANVNWIQKFNIYDNSWEYDSMSIARYGFVIDGYNDFAYLFGGVFDTLDLLSSIERWSNAFTDVGSFNFNNNFNRIFPTGHIVGNNFYIIGGNPLPGTRSDTLAYIIEYNLNTSSVSFQNDALFISEDLPEQQMSEVFEDNIYIFGGIYNGISQDIYKFNTENHSYQKLDIQLLEPRAGGRAIVGSEQNRIYIIGGYNEKLEALSSVEIFTIVGENYYIEQGFPIQEARYNFMSGFINDRIFILGGQKTEDEFLGSIEYLFDAEVTQIDAKFNEKIFNKFTLHQNYPNPFNPITKIKFEVPEVKNLIPNSVNISIKVFDIIGNYVATVINKEFLPGVYSVEFNAQHLTSGVYYYQLSSENFLQTKKMILLK